jgi:hypothetical protein
MRPWFHSFSICVFPLFTAQLLPDAVPTPFSERIDPKGIRRHDKPRTQVNRPGANLTSLHA